MTKAAFDHRALSLYYFLFIIMKYVYQLSLRLSDLLSSLLLCNNIDVPVRVSFTFYRQQCCSISSFDMG